jgi:hypothetical protein
VISTSVNQGVKELRHIAEMVWYFPYSRSPELAMGLVNRVIQRLEVTHEPNLTLAEQLIAVNIRFGFILSYANTTSVER